MSYFSNKDTRSRCFHNNASPCTHFHHPPPLINMASPDDGAVARTVFNEHVKTTSRTLHGRDETIRTLRDLNDEAWGLIDAYEIRIKRLEAQNKALRTKVLAPLLPAVAPASGSPAKRRRLEGPDDGDF